ncbi:3-phosphoshikimate 1-carboxyvinyltransferase [Pseudomonas syringae pv. aptata]|uniref:3-phosphoshikimate 1-carboxyvinyltransferase n=1 Tax=Pseudomonas syringae pv. aptata TaxID=83167 RepID=A0A3M5WFW2_PSEAP|nr:3-phosphoshikimate 1-carboxyvinyltransferase [Pseudomonas syringae pv. aptata]
MPPMQTSSSRLRKGRVKTLGLRLGGVGLLLVLSVQGQAEEFEFDIPAQTLSSALKELGRQCDLQILYNPDDLKGKLSSPVHGRLTPEQAVADLLKKANVAHNLEDNTLTLGAAASAHTMSLGPVAIKGKGGLEAGRIEIDGNLSSQYVSALLMAGACGKGPVEVALKGSEIGARGYLDLTLAAMQAFGAEVQAIGDAAWKVSASGYRATDFHIEPDASAATYLWAAQALTEGAIDLGVASDAFTQPDALASQIIASFPNMPAVIDGSQMQDAIPTLAVLAAFNRQPVRFVGIANLRVKECDRISALSHGLCAIAPGLAVREGDDLIVNANPALAGTTVDALIDTHSDHRIAMCFALAGLKIAGIRILDPDCVGKTYPGYWDALASLGVTVQR